MFGGGHGVVSAGQALLLCIAAHCPSLFNRCVLLTISKSSMLPCTTSSNDSCDTRFNAFGGIFALMLLRRCRVDGMGAAFDSRLILYSPSSSSSSLIAAER